MNRLTSWFHYTPLFGLVKGSEKPIEYWIDKTSRKWENELF